MPRLAKADKAAQTRKINKAKKVASKLPKFNHASRGKLISQDKIDLLDHPAKYKYWIGAKDMGKTKPVLTELLAWLETNKDIQGLSLKKYKQGGSVRLHQALNNVVLEAKSRGFDIPDYEKGVNETYRMKNMRHKAANQQIEYASFDDANGLAGIVAKNNGLFKIVHIEEPVLIDDEGKLPTPKEWKAQMDTIEDSVGRANRNYFMITGKDPGAVFYHFTMNAWDDHPVIEEAQRIFPEEEFLAWALEDILKNHTKAVYHEETDSLYIRGTKFGNPVINAMETILHGVKATNMAEWEEAQEKYEIDYSPYADMNISAALITLHLKENKGKSVLSQALLAIKEDNSLGLARILGMKYEGSQGNAKTYHLENAILADTDKVMRAAKKFNRMTVGVDIDHRRQCVLTPVYHISTMRDPWNEVENVVIGKQIAFPMYKDEQNKTEVYTKTMLKMIEKLYSDATIAFNGAPRSTFLYLDDDKEQYLPHMRTSVLGHARKAKKQGSWDIMHRQDNFQLGVDLGFYIIDNRNVALLSMLKKSIIKEGGKQRDEYGKLEKNYDEINSMEYGMYVIRGLMYRHGIKIGQLDDYIKKEVQDEHMTTNAETDSKQESE